MNTPAAALVARGRLLRGVAASYGQSIAAMLLALITTPIYLHLLGSELFGLWLVTYSVVGTLGISGLGLPQAAAVRLTQMVSTGELNKGARLLVTSAWLTSGFGLLVGSAAALAIHAGWLGEGLFRGSPSVQDAAIPVLMIVGGAYLIGLPFEQCRGVLRAFQRVDIEQMVVTLSRLGSMLSGVAVLSMGGSIISLALSQAVVSLVVSFAWAVGAAYCFRGIRLNLLQCDTQLVRELISPSLHFLVLSVAGALMWSADNVVLASVVGAGAVASYGVGNRLLSMGFTMMSVGLNAIGPALTAIWASRDQKRLQQAFLNSLRIYSVATALLAVEFAFHGRSFIRLWAGQNIVPVLPVFALLLGLFVVRSIAAAFELLVVSSAQHQKYSYLMSIQGIVNLALSILLTQRFGVVGLASAMLISMVIGIGWYLPWKSCRIAQVSAPLVLRHVFLPALLPLCAGSAASLLLAAVPGQGWTAWVFRSTVCAAAFLWTYHLRGMSDWDRQVLARLLDRLRAAIAATNRRA